MHLLGLAPLIHVLLGLLHIALHLVLHGARHCVHHWVLVLLHPAHILLLWLLHLARLSVHELLLGNATILNHFQRIYIVRIIHQIHHQIHISFNNSLGVKEILDSEQIETKLLALGQKAFFFVDEVFWDQTELIGSLNSHTQLLLNESSLFLSTWIRLNVLLSHKVEKLTGDFHKCFFGKQMRIVFELVERYKLDNIGGHVSSIGV